MVVEAAPRPSAKERLGIPPAHKLQLNNLSRQAATDPAKDKVKSQVVHSEALHDMVCLGCILNRMESSAGIF